MDLWNYSRLLCRALRWECRSDYRRGFGFIGYSQVVITISSYTLKITIIITHEESLLYLFALVVAR
jgi:hypothetical protein